jgi:type II secretory pathway component PulF
MADVKIVTMKVDEVREISNMFRGFGSTLKTISKTLEAISNALKLTAWLSLSAAVASAALDQLLLHIKKAAEEMDATAKDIEGAIKALHEGDLSGSQRFV